MQRTINGVTGYTLDDLYIWMKGYGHEGVPEDRNRFRNRIHYYVRAGLIPAPVRVPRDDGKRGTVGVYPGETYPRLVEIFEKRSEQGKTRERLAPLPVKDSPRSQKLISVSAWLPEELVARVEAQIEAGYPQSEQLLLGARLMEWTPERVLVSIIEPLMRAYGAEPKVSANPLDTRWQYALGFTLATHALERLGMLEEQLKVNRMAILKHWRFEFEVVEGQVRIKAAIYRGEDGKELKTEVRDA